MPLSEDSATLLWPLMISTVTRGTPSRLKVKRWL
jgi:hypothetical protein